MACSVAGTAWAEDNAPDATAGAPAPASETVQRETPAPEGGDPTPSSTASSDVTSDESVPGESTVTSNSTSGESTASSSGTSSEASSSSAGSDSTVSSDSTASSDATSDEGASSDSSASSSASSEETLDKSASSDSTADSSASSDATSDESTSSESTASSDSTAAPDSTAGDVQAAKPNQAPAATAAQNSDSEPVLLADNTQTISWNELRRLAGDNVNKVNFYVNLYSEIANSGEGTGETDKENFTNSVHSTTIAGHPSTVTYTPSGEQYVVLQGASKGNAYAVDQNIRALEQHDHETGFRIADVPSDQEIFNKLIEDWDTYVKQSGTIEVGDTTITRDNARQLLNTSNYTIRWYVFKLDKTDCWHVDGILVPKYGRLTVTKTFTFPEDTNLTEENLRSMVPGGFAIQVKSEDSSVENAYTLMMREQTVEDDIAYPGWTSETVDLNNKSITYTWEVDVLDSNYRITEQGADKANRTLTATYTTSTNDGGTLDSNGFVIDCDTAGTDTGSVAMQSATLTNRYSAYDNPEEPTPPAEKPDMPPLVNEKKAIRNEDGTYDLSLSVVGSTVTEEHPANVDVLMVVDTSGSMAQGTGRLTNAKTAMTNMVNTLTAQPGVNAKFSIVDFATNASVHMDWTSSGTEREKNQILAKIRDLSADGGTNWQAGLRSAADQMNQVVSDDAEKIVIFLSDGRPTYCDNGGDGQNFIGEDVTIWLPIVGDVPIFDAPDENLVNTYNTASSIHCDRFYAISLGIADDDKKWMSGLVDAVTGKTSGQYIASSDPNGSDLTSIFSDISGSITNVACNNVTITDTLSQWAEVVLGENEQPEKLMVTVTDAQGQNVTEAEMAAGSIQAVYSKGDDGKETIRLTFASGYQLKNNYTYTVTAKIQPTAAAYADYAGKNAYPHTPDKGTGTHADENEKGYFSNESAKLTYTYVGFEDEEPEEVPFDDPVIQLSNGTVTIHKVITGLEDEPEKLAALVNALTFTLTDDATKATYSAALKDVEPHADGSYTVTIPNVVPGTYTVTESGAEVEGYDVTTKIQESPVTVVVGGTYAVNITNAYTRDNNDLTIKKDVYCDGSDPVESVVVNKANDTIFTFIVTAGAGVDTAKLAGNAEFTVEGGTPNTVKFTETNGVYSARVSVTGANALIIRGLPVGTYTVSEDTSAIENGFPEAYFNGYDFRGSSSTVTLTADDAGHVKVTNYYKSYKTVTIEKKVTENMSSKNDWFQFSFTVTDKNGNDVTPDVMEKITISSTDPEVNRKIDKAAKTFELRGDTSVTFGNLKGEYKITVTETDRGTGYTLLGPTFESDNLNDEMIGKCFDGSGGIAQITIPESGTYEDVGTVTFTNQRKAVAPTGLESDHTAPFALMVGAAFLAGAALLGSVVARRRRRWQG